MRITTQNVDISLQIIIHLEIPEIQILKKIGEKDSYCQGRIRNFALMKLKIATFSLLSLPKSSRV